jgi:hypothetical protein
LEFIANVFAGNDIDHYNFNILDHTNEQGGFRNESRTNSARTYQLTSSNGMVVSGDVYVASIPNFFSRFVSSIHPV